MTGKNEYQELNSTIDELGQAFVQFKQANDEALDKKANGEAFSEIEMKVERVLADVNKLDEKRRRIDTEREADRARLEQLEAMLDLKLPQLW